MENYEELENLSRREIAEFNNFRQVYETKYPVPKLSIAGLGWQFWASVIVAIAGIVLAAFRTAQQFYLAAVYNGEPIFAIGEAIAAVLAIEGTLVLFSAMSAYNKRKVSDFSGIVGKWVAFSISALAGVAQSLNLFTTNEFISEFTGIFQVVLVLSLGLGATVIALFAGDILGVQVVEYENRLSKAELEHKQRTDGYRSRLMKEWKNKDRTPIVIEHRTEPRTERRHHKNFGEQKENIVKTLVSICDTENRVAGVTELANSLGIAKSYVSTVRREWMSENNLTENQND